MESHLLTFDFIAGDDFRQALETDYRDLQACADAKAWKAVLVLAGSIVEALLVDYLVASSYQQRAGKDPLKLELAEAVSVCKSEGILTSRTADLCSVIRSYRNLIHPGRVIRLGDSADEASARIAQSLVSVIVAEVAKARRDAFGLTAEQLLSKLERDSSALAILTHLLQDASGSEKERFLLKVLPVAYLQAEQASIDDFDTWQTNEAFKKRLKEAYRTTFDIVDDTTKRKAVARYAQIIREDGEFVVLTHGAAFMRGADLAFADAPAVDLIREHILSRMKEKLSDQVIWLAHGLERYLESDHAIRWIDAFIRAMAAEATEESRSQQLKQQVAYSFANMSGSAQERVLARLKDWMSLYERRGQGKALATVVALEATLLPDDDDLPF